MAYWVAWTCSKLKPRIFDALQNQTQDHINIERRPFKKHNHG